MGIRHFVLAEPKLRGIPPICLIEDMLWATR
jgi:hypothetical protein